MARVVDSFVAKHTESIQYELEKRGLTAEDAFSIVLGENGFIVFVRVEKKTEEKPA